MKRIDFKLSALILGAAMSTCAMASPTGLYTFIGGGALYLQNAKLNATNITLLNLTPITTNYTIQYNTDKNDWDYALRAAVGYLFNPDSSQSHAFGIEVGYNYFGSKTNSVQNTLTLPMVNADFTLTSSNKTTAWATDFVGVYSQDVAANTNLFIKFGIGYENINYKINNVVNFPTPYYESASLNRDGVGVAGGIGVQYAINQHVAIRAEVDALKGKPGIGYVQGLAGLVFTFN